MTTGMKSGIGKISPIPKKKKKSVYERSLEIPNGEFAGLLTLLEPHEQGSIKKTK